MRPVLLTHCGAGSTREVQDAAERAGRHGLTFLRLGTSALNAVEEATAMLEDDPRLNAGTGSRLRLDGRVQMDAALMDHRRRIGAVAAIESVRNPIRVARRVMGTPHVLLVGADATDFARREGFRRFDPCTERTRRVWREALVNLRKGKLPPSAGKWRTFRWTGTVGAVALDARGGYAAASSTGGTAYMLPGRVGDTPIVGSGFYAGPKGAFTATGVGEEIIRHVICKAAYDLVAAGKSAQRACEQVLKPFPDDVPVGIIGVARGRGGEACNRDMAWWSSKQAV